MSGILKLIKLSPYKSTVKYSPELNCTCPRRALIVPWFATAGETKAAKPAS